MAIENYKVCTRCVMDSSDPTISFREDGTCNYCNDILNRIDHEYLPNEKGRKLWHNYVSEIKTANKNKKYDCIVGISGGLDSTYVLYMGYQAGLRMLAIHIDDGFDTDIAKKNIASICDSTNTKLHIISPDREQYADITLAFMKASVPNICVPQDNLLWYELIQIVKKTDVHYFLSGTNFAMESILQRGNTHNCYDTKHIMAIHQQFGTKPVDKLHFVSFFDKYIYAKYFMKYKSISPLNLIDYKLENVLRELKNFCGYEYYGGKHYESILTRFMQCYYLPVKFQVDKRKSHFSSLIMSGQMAREDALAKLANSPYVSQELLMQDFDSLLSYFKIHRAALESILTLPPKQHSDYTTSYINAFAPIARKFRGYLG